MIDEDYCSFEIAKLLKEKGFDEPCTELNKLCLRDGEKPVLRVTHQKAMKWLREVHHKHCSVSYDYFLKWYFQVIDLVNTVEYDYTEMKIYNCEHQTDFNSYEEAVEAAIKYCLENLI